MLTKSKSETIATFVERTILEGVKVQAVAVHFKLGQHFLLIVLSRSTSGYNVWRGRRDEGWDIMEYLKAASGMNTLAQRVYQQGEFPFVFQGQSIMLPAICKADRFDEKVVLSLLPLLRKADQASA